MSNFEMTLQKAHAAELGRVAPALQALGDGAIPNFLRAMMNAREGKVGDFDLAPVQKAWAEGPIAIANARSRAFRAQSRGDANGQFPTFTELAKANPMLMKAAELDVGTVTNFTQITGGQALGNVSLDTEIVRGTVRPNSFTLYQALNKTPAKQIIDYWPIAEELGGAPVGSAFASYTSVGSGTMATSAGQYDLGYTTLKLMVDGRAITMALAAQNSFVNVAETETANAALVILQTANWAMYWGNPTLYNNQSQGIAGLLPTNNSVDFQAYAAGQTGSLSNEQMLFNLMYESCAAATYFRTNGKITHAFMTPDSIGGLQSLVTTQLNQFVASGSSDAKSPIMVNGNLVGMNTRFGAVQFPLDIFITARQIPLQGIILKDGSNQANTSISAPTSVTAAVNTGVSGSAFTSAYAGNYTYAVAACDPSMNESTLAYTAAVTGVAANGGVTLTITPNGAGAVAFRVFRSGKGYSSGSPDPQQFRFVGEVAANGSNAVTFQDVNAVIPGGQDIFLLDLDEDDNALDYRYLMPLTKVDLYAGNLFLPWAVAMIGAPRVRMPKFHRRIKNYVPTNPSWNPLTAVNPVHVAGD